MPSWSHTVSTCIFTILKTSFIQVFTVGLTTIEIVEGDTEKCILIVHLAVCWRKASVSTAKIKF